MARVSATVPGTVTTLDAPRGDARQRVTEELKHTSGEGRADVPTRVVVRLRVLLHPNPFRAVFMREHIAGPTRDGQVYKGSFSSVPYMGRRDFMDGVWDWMLALVLKGASLDGLKGARGLPDFRTVLRATKAVTPPAIACAEAIIPRVVRKAVSVSAIQVATWQLR